MFTTHMYSSFLNYVDSIFPFDVGLIGMVNIYDSHQI